MAGEGKVRHWLLLKHFPKWMLSKDKESLLIHFGADEVASMPSSGKMKNCVFAAFSSQADAAQALGKLHQLEVFGSRLVVEFAKATQLVQFQGTSRDKWLCNTTPWTEEDDQLGDGGAVKSEAVESKTTVSLPPESSLCYQYPPASHAILTNIANALLCVPKFYTQVLHIMNKMDLPPPFNHPPPLPAPPGVIILPGPCQQQQQLGLEREEWQGSSTELESDDEERVQRRRRKRERASPVAMHVPKRHKVSYQQVKNLRSSLKKASAMASQEESEKNPTQPRTRIELKVPSELASLPPTESSESVSYIESISSIRQVGSVEDAEEEEEGLLQHTCADSLSTQEEMFISLGDLNGSRLTQNEMEESHIFRKYSSGQPSTRLYIKNLTKQVEEKDLRYIFGRYVNWKMETERSMFDIRLMRTGRMKGQAFIGLPNEEVASRAVQETNGFVLHGKPMVVLFARSSKPKGQDQEE